MRYTVINDKKKKIVTPEYLRDERKRRDLEISDYILSKEYLKDLGFKMVNKNKDIEFYANMVNVRPYKTIVFEEEMYIVPNLEQKREIIIVSLRSPSKKDFSARINIPKSNKYLKANNLYSVLTGVVFVYLFLRYYHSVKKILNNQNIDPKETEMIFSEFRKTAPIPITFPTVKSNLRDCMVALNIINKRMLAERLKYQSHL